MDEEAFLFMKGIRGALCFHSALHSALMLFFPWPLLPRAREEFDKVTLGPHYLFFSSHLSCLSQILIVRLAGLYHPLISSVGSHLWAALVPPTPALPLSFILVLKRPVNRQVWFNLLHPQANVRDKATTDKPLRLTTSCSPLVLSTFLTEPEPSGKVFLCHTLLKHTFVSRGMYSDRILYHSLLPLHLYVTYPNPRWSVLLLLKGPILFDLTKVTEESEKHWESASRGGFTCTFNTLRSRGCSPFCFMLHPGTLPASLAYISTHLVIRQIDSDCLAWRAEAASAQLRCLLWNAHI